jgi:hypothetical protein
LRETGPQWKIGECEGKSRNHPMQQADLFAFEEEATRSLLDELLQRSRLYETTEDFKGLIDFVVRLRNFAPFNAMLLQIQKPGLRFAASAHDWEKRFARTIKEGARPLLILWPFGPVALVYDLEDTEGELLPVDVAQTFRANGNITPDKIKGFIPLLARKGIELKLIPFGDAKAGYVKVIRRSIKAKEKPEYQVRVNETHDSNVQFATLVHELGHLFLGHLGLDKYLNIPERLNLSHDQRELEAEALSYIVCIRNDVASEAEKYLANFIQAKTTTQSFDLYLMLKATGQVETVLGLTAHTSFIN